MPPLCEDRLEVLVVWEAAVAHNDASSYVSQQMMANDEVLTNPIHDTWLHQGEISRTMCTPGLHESLQPCSRAARKWRENEEMKRKRRGNGERMRKWRKNFLILSLYPPSLSISYIKICHTLSQNLKYGTFVTNVTKNLTYALWENNSGSTSLRESSASCKGMLDYTFYVYTHIKWQTLCKITKGSLFHST